MFRRASAAWPVLALAAFWLPVLAPLVQPNRMTCSHDGMLHLLRAFQLDVLAQQGVWWPRWSPGMVLGYGYPLFNFYPALSLYPTLILHRLGLSLLPSWNLSMALSVLASGLTMYLWSRQVVGRRGGFVAAVAYMLAPYQLYDVYWRGNITESLTLPLLPLVMWAALQVTQQKRWRYAALGALAFASILLMHAAASLIFSVVLLTYLATLVWSTQDRGAAVVRLLSMLILGVGLAAFFLAPAYLEREQVQFWRAITPGGQNFENHFLGLGELLGPAPASDPALANPSPPRSLGWVTGGLAAMGVLATWLERARVGCTHKHHVAWASLALPGILVMTLSVSEPIWSHVPLLPFVQFPWRFLGVGSLLSGLLAGAGAATLDGHARRDTLAWRVATGAAVGVCVAALSLGALPWAYPRLCAAPDAPDQAFYVKYERSTGLIGTTSSAEYLPVGVQEIPVTSPMVKAMRTGQPFVRWDAPGARVLEARDDGLSAELVVESDTPIQVTYRAFYFPGWQATLDGQPVPLQVTPPLGLMAIDISTGHHTLTLRFGNTLLRTISEIISLVMALAIVAIGIRDLRSEPRSPASKLQPLYSTTWLGLAALGIALFALKVGVVDRYDTLLRWRRLQDGQFKGATFVSDAVVAGSIRLLGYDTRPNGVAAGDVLYTDLYWTLDKPLDLRTAVRLLDQNGVEWSAKSELDAALGSYAGLPSSAEWQPGMYADDRHAIRVLPGAPPGDYVLVAVPFKPDTLEPLPISMGQSAPGGYPGVAVGKVRVVAPSRPPSVGALDLDVRTDMPVGADLTLLGYSQDRSQVAPGETMLLVFGWQARRKPQTDYVLRLELLAPDGQVVTQLPFSPGGDSYPTSRWSAGEVIRTLVLARIPGRAASGEHTWRLTQMDGGAPFNLGRLQIVAPTRAWSAPTMQRRVDVRLGDWVALAGFDAPAQAAAGQSLKVTLVWQALGETEQEYKVFVQLLDAGGHPVAQADAVPAAWQRPTSGWQAGEFVTDAHTLDLQPDLPPGDYRLIAGMYDMIKGQRLPVASGGDLVELGPVQVSEK